MYPYASSGFWNNIIRVACHTKKFYFYKCLFQWILIFFPNCFKMYSPTEVEKFPGFFIYFLNHIMPSTFIISAELSYNCNSAITSAQHYLTNPLVCAWIAHWDIVTLYCAKLPFIKIFVIATHLVWLTATIVYLLVK